MMSNTTSKGDNLQHLIAYVEVWYNRNTRDWVVECKSAEGYAHWRGSDYVYTLASALTIAGYQSKKYGNCPIKRTTSTGTAYKGRATAVRTSKQN